MKDKIMMHRLRGVMFGLFYVFVIFMVVGCGSSGDSPSDSTVTDTAFSINVELFDGGGLETRTISEGDPGKLRITVKTSSGGVAVNQFLEVTTSKGSFLNSDGTAITNSSGVAEFTLVADGANGAGTIDVSVGESSLYTPFSFQIGVSDSVNEAGSIAFVAAEPTHIALAGTSNPILPAISVVTFVVKDEAGNPAPNELVNFSLSTSVGGISLSPLSAETDSEGIVRVTVTSGSVPTSVRVNATVNDSQVTTVSSSLVISTGLPDQNSFSISAATLNPEALNINGVVVAVTVRAGDHFNNPVPDGTSIYFTTEGGAIDPTCSTVNGACSVNWWSQNPPPNNGRVTILATALGEESFTDGNGSGRYESSSDTLDEDEDEAFVDKNENGLHDVDEEFLDYNGDLLFTTGNGMYNGTLCVTGCSNDLIHVRDSIVLSMSGSSALITINPSAITLSGLVDVSLTVSDINGNSMPSGSTVSLTAPDNATLEGESSFDIPNNITTSSVFTFTLKPDGTSLSGTQSTLQVKVTSPSGSISTRSAVCTTP